MKFIVSSSHLLKQLSLIKGVLTANPVVPILENFLFDLEEGKLTVTSSDLQTSMIVEVDVESKDTGMIAVPAKALLETLANLPEQPVTIKINPKIYSIEIISDNGRYKLSGENAGDYPRIPEVQGNQVYQLPSGMVSRAIQNAFIVVSTDELRPAMTGVYIQIKDTGIVSFTATDGHRLVNFNWKHENDWRAASVIVPRKAIGLIRNMIQDGDIVEMEFSQTNARFNFGLVKIVCRVIDERYPDFENVIPKDNDNIITIDRMQLLGAMKRIAIYANKTTHQVRLKVTGNELVASAEDLDFSNEANERLLCEHTGPELEIGFNAQFLVQLVGNIESKNIELKLSAPNKAGLIFPAEKEENEDLLMLVMPVMLNNYV